MILDLMPPVRQVTLTAVGKRRKVKANVSYRNHAGTLRFHGGRMKGRLWDPDSCPHQSWLIDQMDSGRWMSIALCAPPQISGKTQVLILLPITLHCIRMGNDCGYALPTGKDLDKSYKSKLLPALRGSGYGDHLPQHGPGSRDGRPAFLTFSKGGKSFGSIQFMAGGAKSDTVMILCVDEVDYFRGEDGRPKWKDLEDLYSRCNSYGDDALRLYTGTVEFDFDCIILHLTDVQGTGTRVWQQCPYCGQHQIVEWSQVVYDGSTAGTARATAQVKCAHCSKMWSEEDRIAAIRNCLYVHKGQTVNDAGKIIGPEPDTDRRLGLVYTAWDSVLVSLGETAANKVRADDLAAQGSVQLLKKWWNYNGCCAYTDQTRLRNTSEELLCRRSADSDYAKGIAPDWAEHFVRMIDVQKDRCYVVDQVASNDEKHAIVNWNCVYWSAPGEEPSDTARQRVLDQLYAEAESGMPRKTSANVPLGRVGIDIGFDSAKIGRWIASKELAVAIRGEGEDEKMRARRGEVRPHKKEKGGKLVKEHVDGLMRRIQNVKTVPMTRFYVQTSLARERLRAAHNLELGTPGAMHLPTGLQRADDFIKHLLAWRLLIDEEDDSVEIWHKTTRARDDYDDGQIYGWLMLRYLIERSQKAKGRPQVRGQRAPRQDRRRRGMRVYHA